MDTHVVFSIHTCSRGKEWQLIDVAYVRIWFGFVVDLEHVWNTFRRTTFLVGLGVVGGRGNSCVGGREEADMGWWDGRGRGEVGGRPPQSPGARHQGRVSEQNVQEMKDQRKTIFKTKEKLCAILLSPSTSGKKLEICKTKVNLIILSKTRDCSTQTLKKLSQSIRPPQQLCRILVSHQSFAESIFQLFGINGRVSQFLLFLNMIRGT